MPAAAAAAGSSISRFALGAFVCEGYTVVFEGKFVSICIPYLSSLLFSLQSDSWGLEVRATVEHK